MTDRTYILYDDRAFINGTEHASVLEVCEDNDEALACRGDYGSMACYSYAEQETNSGTSILVDERFEWNWFPGQPTTGPWPN